MNNLSSEAHGMEKCDETQLETRLKNPFLDDDPFEQLGSEKNKIFSDKTSFSANLPTKFQANEQPVI